MKNFKKQISLIMAVLVVVGVFGVMPVQASTAKINKSSLYLAQGKSYTLKVNGTTKKIKWSSGNKKIATVTETGVVKAVSTGKTTITANVGNKNYESSLTVVKKLNEKDFVYKANGKSYDFIKGNTKNYWAWDKVFYSNDERYKGARNLHYGSSITEVKKKFGETKVRDDNGNVKTNDLDNGCMVYQYKKGKDTYSLLFYIQENKVHLFAWVKNCYGWSDNMSDKEKMATLILNVQSVVYVG